MTLSGHLPWDSGWGRLHLLIPQVQLTRGAVLSMRCCFTTTVRAATASAVALPGSPLNLQCWAWGLSLSSESVVQSLSHVWLFVTPWTAAHQASLSFTNSQSLLKLMSTHVESVMPSNHLILCCPLLLLLSIFPSIRVSSNELAKATSIKWLKNWSFSFRSSNEYSGLISFRLIGLISLLSKGFSRVFSNTTVQKDYFFGAQASLWSKSHICTWLLEKP